LLEEKNKIKAIIFLHVKISLRTNRFIEYSHIFKILNFKFVYKLVQAYLTKINLLFFFYFPLLKDLYSCSY